MLPKKNRKTQGQALVEFALILTVLLMMIFLVIESARILWAWNTVQNAAREGARYAITGRFDTPVCPDMSSAKFAALCSSTDSAEKRVASIFNTVHKGLSGLPLNETSGIFEDDNYYQIEVWGINDQGQLTSNYAGMPNTPVVVRAFYQVPIISPFLNTIVPSVPVFGQVTMNNESFGQLGNAAQGQGVPPVLPPIPTAGVTPSPTPTPTNTPTPSPGPSDTPSPTPSPTLTPTPDFCGLQFEAAPVAGNHFVLITGEPGHIVTIFDQSTAPPTLLGSQELLARDGHACAGFASFDSPNDFINPLIGGHLLIADSNNIHDDPDTAFVLLAPPTDTPTPTHTPEPTLTTSPTPTATASPTPGNPYLILQPNCGTGPDVQFIVQGVNWPYNETVALYWNTNELQSTINTGTSRNFIQTWVNFGLSDGDYEVVAVSAGHTASATFTVPCINPPTATPATSTPTSTPAPADLLIVGPPEMISTPPIVAYQPVEFRVVISNTGGIDVSNQFFVDVYLDPTTVLTTTIPITQSGGYQGIGSLAGDQSRVITITVPLGFGNEPEEHHVYGMVDSLEQISESDETNNISVDFTYDLVTPAPTPTPSPTPNSGADNIFGVLYRPTEKGLSPLLRATVRIIDASTSQVVAVTTSDPFTGVYQFPNLPPGSTYNVLACGTLSTATGPVTYFGQRTGITLPHGFPVNVYTDTSLICP